MKKKHESRIMGIRVDIILQWLLSDFLGMEKSKKIKFMARHCRVKISFLGKKCNKPRV